MVVCNLHPHPNVDVTAGHGGCTEEYMSTIAPGTCNLDGVLATVRGSGIE